MASNYRSFGSQLFTAVDSFPHGDLSVGSEMISIDWMISIDLKDAYLQVPTHPLLRKYLLFVRKYLLFVASSQLFQF